MKPTLVCFALKEEAGPFRRRAEARPDVAILFTGIGRRNAEQRLREFLADNQPSLVLTCGFAGGLNPGLTLGAVVFAADDATLAAKLTGAGAKPARFVSADKIATTVAEKAELRRRTGADAVEMESEAIHAVCRERGIPCATVRVISDTAAADLPLDFNQLSKPDQSLDFVKLAAALIKQPGKIPSLLRLQKNCGFAAQRLAEVLVKVI